MKSINTPCGPNTEISVLKQVEHTVIIETSNIKLLIVRRGSTAARLLGLRVQIPPVGMDFGLLCELYFVR